MNNKSESERLKERVHWLQTVDMEGGWELMAEEYIIIEDERTHLQKLVEEQSKERESLIKHEKALSDAYLRIRSLVGAWNTNHGGENRFEVTEKAVADLLAKVEEQKGEIERYRHEIATLMTDRQDQYKMGIEDGHRCTNNVKELEAEIAKLKSSNAMLESAVNGANQMLEGHDKSYADLLSQLATQTERVREIQDAMSYLLRITPYYVSLEHEQAALEARRVLNKQALKQESQKGEQS